MEVIGPALVRLRTRTGHEVALCVAVRSGGAVAVLVTRLADSDPQLAAQRG